MDELWTAFANQASNEDVKVREALVKACGQILIKNGSSWQSKVVPLLVECIDDKAIVVRERTFEAITDVACHDIELISDDTWDCVIKHIYEKKEKPRQCAVDCLTTVWHKLDGQH